MDTTLEQRILALWSELKAQIQNKSSDLRYIRNHYEYDTMLRVELISKETVLIDVTVATQNPFTKKWNDQARDSINRKMETLDASRSGWLWAIDSITKKRIWIAQIVNDNVHILEHSLS